MAATVAQRRTTAIGRTAHLRVQQVLASFDAFQALEEALLASRPSGPRGASRRPAGAAPRRLDLPDPEQQQPEVEAHRCGAAGSAARSGPSREKASGGFVLVEAADRGGGLRLGVAGRAPRRRGVLALGRERRPSRCSATRRGARGASALRAAAASAASWRAGQAGNRRRAGRSWARTTGRPGAKRGWSRSSARTATSESG